MLAFLVQLGRRVEVIDLAVDPHAAETLAVIFSQLLAVFALAAAHHRRQQIEPGAFLHRQKDVDHLADGLAADGKPCRRRVGDPDPRPQQAHIVVNLGDGADRRTRVARCRLLLDRDRRRQTFDEVDIRLLHHLQKLACVGGQRFDIAALPLGVNCIEGERGFAGAGQAGQHHKPVAWQVNADVGEIVLARASNRDQARFGALFGAFLQRRMDVTCDRGRGLAVDHLRGCGRGFLRFIGHRANIPATTRRDQPKGEDGTAAFSRFRSHLRGCHLGMRTGNLKVYPVLFMQVPHIPSAKELNSHGRQCEQGDSGR